MVNDIVNSSIMLLHSVIILNVSPPVPFRAEPSSKKIRPKKIRDNVLLLPWKRRESSAKRRIKKTGMKGFTDVAEAGGAKNT
jgi:hypothetical protein